MNSDAPRRSRVSAAREEEFLDAALMCLGDVGYDSLSMDLVAERAQCSKATLYRRWSSKGEMVVAAIESVGPPPFAGIDTGTLRGDLVELMRRISEGAEHDRRFAAAIHHAVMVDEQLAAAVRRTFLEPEARFLESVVVRAVQRGELSSRPRSADFLQYMVFSAIMTGPLTDAEPLDSEYRTRIIDEVILPSLRSTMD
ncbi:MULTISPECIES: TetR/AcrR family transcriptional regulator [unclassified Rhodococcus (in: high G+C Gram-positive bacteria)]|uniref:TetR/AcrR family transcriptional regulator n=1 Tax=unclassified Rhodococcus (in: high G+C Gram-positive bacteria) TaxID=192944 RepID=UPI0011ED6AC3|nr:MULTISPECIES: TetR/AcrR family transcriptional regulator [unclassified Rhodococcus (in: high G+C Gram-positive bacteria)]KAA0925049.1 TetR/AcrR family transcriptional regulator [Rhodococcus sp. ANT_H53B]MDI9927868.1 TetR/AcrR family transcriptional regulator [Rhodococcus sp. IEGM 1341]MDV8055797.1 TetR/AcrR family transcriptional regulator [Rhodococcus sp. IEGM 1343]MDV8078614.1 TetR/AcrR family transcriptional regulator [Rhodococcus sp. IEGM 1370]